MFDREEFEMLYDDWMILDCVEIKKNNIAKELSKCIELKYSSKKDTVTTDDDYYLYNKVLTLHQKIAMMQFAECNFHNEKYNFESSQNMDIPAFYGMGKTTILFYIESMILFARNALDISATICSDLIFEKRTDSFNEFSKWIMKSDARVLDGLKQYFEKQKTDNLSVFKLLCGTERGRALRDIIIHQANIKLDYCECQENSEKESMVLLLKDFEPMEVDAFMSWFVVEYDRLFNIVTSTCESYLKDSEKI